MGSTGASTYWARRTSREFGLETKELFVVAGVEASPHPVQIAAALLLHKASVTVCVRNLVAKGFIRREIDDADLRRHRLEEMLGLPM